MNYLNPLVHWFRHQYVHLSQLWLRTCMCTFSAAMMNSKLRYNNWIESHLL